MCSIGLTRYSLEMHLLTNLFAFLMTFLEAAFDLFFELTSNNQVGRRFFFCFGLGYCIAIIHPLASYDDVKVHGAIG